LVSKRKNSGEWGMANGEWRMTSGEWRVASGEYAAGPEWLIGGGCVVSETHPQPFPKGREAPSCWVFFFGSKGVVFI